MATPDIDIIKEVPGYRVILKAVLKSQIQQLIEQLASATNEESIILTASVADGTLSHLGSDSAKGFLEDHEDVKSQFLGFCLKAHHRKKQEEKEAKERKEREEALMRLQQQSTPLYLPLVPRGGYSPRGPRNMVPQHQGPVGRGSPGVNSGVRFDPYKRPGNYGNNGPPSTSLTSVKNELDDISNRSAENTGNQLMRENMNVKTELVNEDNLSGSDTSNAANSQCDINQEGLELGADFTNFMSEKSDSNARVKLEAADNDLEITGVEAGQPMLPQDWGANVSMGANFDPTGATGSQADMTGQQGYSDRLLAGDRLQCQLCDKRFHNSSNLRRHLRIHTGARPFTCEVCGRSFNQTTSLKSHMVLHYRDVTL
ncbi:hypothetical protein DPMN_021541 [Dreissena polymorpha]|uniref:C2H2-type domain-containing protein n=1 Tax=Dreissena polymorpha TaxID=45954 RepID=A0A9D4NMC2_DREPO|nr:hypothetical protein DPMN_021541 [Dreissena polymorpha]